VSGIAGAIGNNGKGVSGVNWNVKILPVAGSSATSEAIVVEALSYVYTVRETYDNTNGERGAFVVADNCSFGVDKGNPDHFPIWEAMYDSLGRLGVLSVGATANHAWDIDSVGDVPTAFTTDYMISVTNTTKIDELYFSAGWGDTTIDLGAPGTLIMSCRVNNGYGNNSGTSMAAPHVTGAAALILSAADSSFIASYKNQPGEGTLLIKEYIMDGVKKLNSLLNVTVSGGRLNVFKAINLMLDAPVIQVDKDSVKVAFEPNVTGEDSILITNTGVKDLNYTIHIPDQPAWISLDKTEGTLSQDESESVVLYFDTEGLENGLYYTKLVVEGNRTFSKTVEVKMLVDPNVGTGEIEVRTLSTVSVFPNPFTNKATFEIDASENGDIYLEIFDQKGGLVFEQQQKVAIGSTQIFWENTRAADGIYFYKISLNGEIIKTGKLVKN
jgi:subtilisin family serine protease